MHDQNRPLVEPCLPAALCSGLCTQDGAPGEKWEAISNLDDFFGRVYTYYRERGLRCILASRIFSLLTLAFILFFIYLVEMLNWDEVLHVCQDDVSCAQITLFRSHWLSHSLFFNIFYLLFSCYWGWTCAVFVSDLRPLFEMRALYRDKLQLQDADLQVVAWDEIVAKLVELQQHQDEWWSVTLLRASETAGTLRARVDVVGAHDLGLLHFDIGAARTLMRVLERKELYM